MEKDISNFSVVFEKLDMAIEKISEVSTDLTRMLAVHEEKLSVHEEKIAHNKNNATMAQESIKEDIKDLHSRITTVNREVSANIIATETKIIANQNGLEKKIMDGQDELKKYFMHSHTTLERRVKTLENWRYVLVGIFLAIGIAIGFLTQNSIVPNP